MFQWVEARKAVAKNDYGRFPCDELWENLGDDQSRTKHTTSMKVPSFTVFHTARQHYISSLYANLRPQPQATHTRRPDPSLGARSQVGQLLNLRDVRLQSSSLPQAQAQDEPMASPDVGQ